MNNAAWVKLILEALPGALQIITIVRGEDGTTTVMILDSAIQKAEETKAMIAAWKEAHPEQ